MKNMKKAISLLLASVLLLSVIPAAAIGELTDSEASFTTGEGVTGDNEVQVSVTKGSTYTITVPKTVILSGANGEGEYTVKVTGDLSGSEAITVEPYTTDGVNLLEEDEFFLLSQAGKNDIYATVTQTKTEWSYGNLDDGKGTISVANLTSGSWSGNFVFNINRVETAVMMLEGDGQIVNKFAFPEVRFRTSAPVDTLNEVKINGEVVDPDNYIVTEGSTIITLKNDYVESLDLGEGTIEIVSTNGIADGGFTVVNLIPEGGYYYCANGEEYGPGEKFPTAPQKGDFYEYGDYEYAYGYVWCALCGIWNFENFCYCGYGKIDHWGLHVYDTTKTEYELPLTQINGDYISDWTGAFYGCSNLKELPDIPQNVTNINGAFAHCTSLTDLSDFVIPKQITSLYETFYGCSNLVKPPVIPNQITDMSLTFCGCTSLIKAPTIPSSVTSMMSTFNGCVSLTKAPIIPVNVTNMHMTFAGCENLKTYVGSTDTDGDFSNYVIPNGVTTMHGTFEYCKFLTKSPIIPNRVTNMWSTFLYCTSLAEAPVIPESVTDMMSTFADCIALTTAPVIPNNVEHMWNTFKNCTSLTGTITINANPDEPQAMNQWGYADCFNGVDFAAQNLTLAGSSTKLDVIGTTGTNYCANCNGVCKE